MKWWTYVTRSSEKCKARKGILVAKQRRRNDLCVRSFWWYRKPLDQGGKALYTVMIRRGHRETKHLLYRKLPSFKTSCLGHFAEQARQTSRELPEARCKGELERVRTSRTRAYLRWLRSVEKRREKSFSRRLDMVVDAIKKMLAASLDRASEGKLHPEGGEEDGSVATPGDCSEKDGDQSTVETNHETKNTATGGVTKSGIDFTSRVEAAEEEVREWESCARLLENIRQDPNGNQDDEQALCNHIWGKLQHMMGVPDNMRTEECVKSHLDDG